MRIWILIESEQTCARPVISQDLSRFHDFFTNLPLRQGRKGVACIVSKPLVSCLWRCGESVNPPILNIQEVEGALSSRPKGEPFFRIILLWSNHTSDVDWVGISGFWSPSPQARVSAFLIFFYLAMKRCPITAKIAGLIGISVALCFFLATILCKWEIWSRVYMHQVFPCWQKRKLKINPFPPKTASPHPFWSRPVTRNRLIFVVALNIPHTFWTGHS